jgi:hypothetical protein
VCRAAPFQLSPLESSLNSFLEPSARALGGGVSTSFVGGVLFASGANDCGQCGGLASSASVQGVDRPGWRAVPLPPAARPPRVWAGAYPACASGEVEAAAQWEGAPLRRLPSDQSAGQEGAPFCGHPSALSAALDAAVKAATAGGVAGGGPLQAADEAFGAQAALVDALRACFATPSALAATALEGTAQKGTSQEGARAAGREEWGVGFSPAAMGQLYAAALTLGPPAAAAIAAGAAACASELTNALYASAGGKGGGEGGEIACFPWPDRLRCALALWQCPLLADGGTPKVYTTLCFPMSPLLLPPPPHTHTPVALGVR